MIYIRITSKNWQYKNHTNLNLVKLVYATCLKPVSFLNVLKISQKVLWVKIPVF